MDIRQLAIHEFKLVLGDVRVQHRTVFEAEAQGIQGGEKIVHMLNEVHDAGWAWPTWAFGRHAPMKH